MEELLLSDIELHGFNDVRYTGIYTAGILFPKPSAFEINRTREKRKRHKTPGIDQFPTELIKKGHMIIRSLIYKLVSSVWNEEELPEQRKESIIVPFERGSIKQVLLTKEAYLFYQLHAKLNPVSFVKCKSIYRGHYLGQSAWILT